MLLQFKARLRILIQPSFCGYDRRAVPVSMSLGTSKSQRGEREKLDLNRISKYLGIRERRGRGERESIVEQGLNNFR